MWLCRHVARARGLRNAGLHAGGFGSVKGKAVGHLLRESWGIVMMEITGGREHDNLRPHG